MRSSIILLLGSQILATQAFLVPTTRRPINSNKQESGVGGWDSKRTSAFKETIQRARNVIVSAVTIPAPVSITKQQSNPAESKKEKRVYLFREGSKDMKYILGGKGANLAEMTNIGLPVPPGFTITAQTCLKFFESGQKLPDGVEEEYLQAIKDVETATGRQFGNPANPLLFSVRSGAAISMPGMMDTVLSLGINDEVAANLAKKSGNSRWAYDTYRRFIQMFACVVMGEDHHKFEEILTAYKKSQGYIVDTDMSAEDWKVVIEKYKKIVNVPTDPHVQLRMAISAVFQSWFTPRAKRYRLYNDIPDNLGTAVTVQSMVFGNWGEDSGTGVMFTRNPSTGFNENFGEYLVNAAGEDVVAGIRTPIDLKSLTKSAPSIYQQLMSVHERLETHYKDMQDIEFTVQEGKLYILQCRSGKRTAKAGVKIAVDMYREGLITREEALLRVDAKMMDYFLHPTIDPKATRTVVAKGLPASPGVGTGAIVFNSDEAEAQRKEGKKVILVRKETTAEDIHGMKAAEGILTEQGGMTSHAAVVARGMGKCCVSGAQEIEVDQHAETLTLKDGKVLKKGDIVTIDGSTGEVMLGSVPMTKAGTDADFQLILQWSDEIRKLKVKANADTPEDAKKARELGAEGIGLCRTEHMFFEPKRIDVVRQMILAEDKEERIKHLDQMFEFQRQDMREILTAMSGYPVTIRLLDPPLHEFLPQEEGDIKNLAQRLGRSYEKTKHAIEALAETNPMLGFRGCRLTIIYPEITEMQVRAAITAAYEAKKDGADPKLEIMVPLVSIRHELEFIIDLIHRVAQETMKSLGKDVVVSYKVGTMLELPRACIMADRFAPIVEFMSFGTNDLTQMTYGFSRDDIGKFLPSYIENKVLQHDPFATLDTKGVGSLMNTAIKLSRDPEKFSDRYIAFGICGEHGGDPSSIAFCESLGMDYTSCSPFRVPIARIAAAQATIRPGGFQQD